MGNTLQNSTQQTPPPQDNTHNDEEHISNTKEQEQDEDDQFYDAEEETEQEDAEELFTCQICIEPTLMKESTTPNTITKCTHRYCADCMVKYIKVKIEDDNEAHVKCPAPDCDRELDPVASAPLVGPALFVRWCDVLCRSALSSSSGIDTCYCPYADCSELLFSDCTVTTARQRHRRRATSNNNNKKSQCPMCKRWFCFGCKKVWHAGFGCDDVATDGADVEFGRLAERMTWTRCPNCRHFVERRGGCRAVKCRCGIRFCYKCGKKILKGYCNCDDSYDIEHCCSICIRTILILAFLVLPWLIVLAKPNKHRSH